MCLPIYPARHASLSSFAMEGKVGPIAKSVLAFDSMMSGLCFNILPQEETKKIQEMVIIPMHRNIRPPA